MLCSGHSVGTAVALLLFWSSLMELVRGIAKILFRVGMAYTNMYICTYTPAVIQSLLPNT